MLDNVKLMVGGGRRYRILSNNFKYIFDKNTLCVLQI